MHGILWQHNLLINEDVRVGQVDDECRIVIAQVRAKQQRRTVIDQQLQAREESCVTEKQPVGTSRRGAEIAVAVEHREGIVVLEHTPQPRRRLRRGNIERLLGVLEDRDWLGCGFR